MILIVDNYDSFVETLARYVREAGYETVIVRNDAYAPGDIAAMHAQAVILSPGPYGPGEAGVCRALPDLLRGTPLLGVCLGHLAIAEAYGGRTVPSPTPVHGRATPVRHDGDPLFKGVPSPFEAGRYHALASDITSTDLQPTAWAGDETLMALRHPDRPHRGVQFHPESVLTLHGRTIIGNFLKMVQP